MSEMAAGLRPSHDEDRHGARPPGEDPVSRGLRDLYRRASRYYDILDWPFEHCRYRRLRRDLWSGLQGRILDLGAGTGRNAAHYPPRAEVVATDLSLEMLRRARPRIVAASHRPALVVSDALELALRTGTLDACVSTFLFCVLPDEVQASALGEIRRVLRPGGRLYLLEYTYSRRPIRRLWMATLAPLVQWLYGARFDRRTREHVLRAGFRLVEEGFVCADTILLLVAET